MIVLVRGFPLFTRLAIPARYRVWFARLAFMPAHPPATPGPELGTFAEVFTFAPNWQCNARKFDTLAVDNSVSQHDATCLTITSKLTVPVSGASSNVLSMYRVHAVASKQSVTSALEPLVTDVRIACVARDPVTHAA